MVNYRRQVCCMAPCLVQNNKTAPTPKFSFCHLSNVSYCPVTQAGGTVAAVFWNPLGWPASTPVRVPLAAGLTSVAVLDSTGAAVRTLGRNWEWSFG
jgi:hypothetical protein